MDLAFHSHTSLYEYTPTIVYLVGLFIILGSAPICIMASQRLFTCSPVRLHPLKLRVIQSYFKLVAFGRINWIGGHGMGSTDVDALLQDQQFRKVFKDEVKALTTKLRLNHELWAAWIKKAS